MSALSIQPTFPIFTETDGLPLENGYIWIGAANLDPQGNPINVYWDAALTIAAPQPIRTLNGYPSRNGTPGRLYVNSDYSIRVMNKNGSVVYSAPAATERYNADVITSVNVNALEVVYDPAGANAVQTNVESKLRETVSVFDFMTDAQIADVRAGTALIDVTAAIQAALDYQQTATSTSTAATGETLGTAPVVFFPEGQYLISSSLNIKSAYAWLLGEQATLKKATVFTGTAGLQMAGGAWRIHIKSLQFQDFAVGLYLDSSNLNSGQVGIHNCGFFGCTDRGIWLDVQSTATTIKDCMFRANKHDLWVETGDVVILEGGWIQREGDQLTDNYDGAIVNYGNMFVRNVLGVPQPETLITEPAWFANYNNLDVDGFRFGGEAGGFCAVNNFTSADPWGTQTAKRSVALRNCQLYVGGDPAIRLFYVPNLIVLDNNSGLTGSGAYAVGWSSSVSAPDQALRLPVNKSQARWFNIINNNSGQDNIVDANLLAYATTKRQLRLFSDAANTQNVIFDYLQETIASGDIYGTIEWKGYDLSNPSNAGRRGAIIGRSSSTLGGLELAFLTGISNGAVTERLVIQDNGALRPAADNTQQLGTASFRWSEVFAGNGTINTSDGREKQDVAALDDAEKRVAVALKGLVKKFRFKDAVDRKGDAARIHVGVIAQEVISAFEAEGLDPMRYSLVCYDKWDAVYHDVMETKTVVNADGTEEEVRFPTGEKILVLPAGDRYGIRYEELLAFMISAM